MHLKANMGDLLAKVLTNFWSHVAILFCAFALTTYPLAHADEIHEGISISSDDLTIPMDSGPGEEPEPRDGAVVGNIPAKPKPEDFLFKNRKEKEYPLEFLIPFMKVSQVFRKRVPAKADVPEQSAMAPAPKVRSALSYSAKLPPAQPLRAGISNSVTDDLTQSLNEAESRRDVESTKRVLGTRPAPKPSRQLIDSLKATQGN